MFDRFFGQPDSEPLRITSLALADGSHHALMRAATGQRFARVIAWCVLQTSASIPLVEGIVLGHDGRLVVAPLATGEQFERYIEIEEGLHGD